MPPRAPDPDDAAPRSSNRPDPWLGTAGPCSGQGDLRPSLACRGAHQRCCMTAVDEQPSLSYLARRGVAAQWRGFLRALVETLDANLDAASRDALLRAVGARMAGLMPLPACGSLPELEARIND